MVTNVRAELGVVYTPQAVCAAMVRCALEPLIAGRTRDQILALRICDPAIGEGAFLIEIVRVLAEAIEVPAPDASPRDARSPLDARSLDVRSTIDARSLLDARRLAAERCIFGVDIDANAVAAARAAVERFVGASLPSLEDHLRVANALTCEWDLYDAVVGNPPYIRQERLDDKTALRAYATYDGVADLYVYFVELAHRITRQGGRYCLIVPSKWLTAAYGRALRAYLARESSIEGVVDFGRALPLFADADAFPCILWGTVGARHTEPIRAARVVDHAPIAQALAEVATPHARDRWGAAPWHIDEPGVCALIDRWSRRWPSLGDFLPDRPSRGVVTGCNRAFVIDAATRERLLAEEPAAAAVIRPFVKGRDLRRWRAAAIDRYVLLVDHGTSLAELPRVLAHLAQFREALEPRPPYFRGAWHGRKPARHRWYELQDPVVPLAKSRRPRLLYQDIQTSPACCLDASGELVPDTTVWILPSGDRYLLAVLNSRLYGWYARRRFPPALNGAVRPKLEYMRALPIATPSSQLRARIEGLVERQLADPAAAIETAIDLAICEAYEVSPSVLA